MFASGLFPISIDLPLVWITAQATQTLVLYVNTASIIGLCCHQFCNRLPLTVLLLTGHLLACVMNEIISAATSIEDFSADGASKLHQLITEVVILISLLPGALTDLGDYGCCFPSSTFELSPGNFDAKLLAL